MEDFGYLKEEKNRFSWLYRKIFLIGATLFSIICFIYVTVSAYNFVYEDPSNHIKTIKSPDKPLKVTATNKVKKNSKDTNSIYDDIFGHKDDSLAQIIPKVYLAPEPVHPPKEKKIKAKKRDNIIVKSKTKPTASKKEEPEAIKEDTRIVVYTDQKTDTEPSKDLLTKGTVEAKTTKRQKKPSTRGRVKVQIAALTSEKSVKQYWQKLNRNSPKLFSGLKLFTKKVDLGKRGIFYRVQIGNFSDQIAAEEFCDKYISQARKSRADCIVVE